MEDFSLMKLIEMLVDLARHNTHWMTFVLVQITTDSAPNGGRNIARSRGQHLVTRESCRSAHAQRMRLKRTNAD